MDNQPDQPQTENEQPSLSAAPSVPAAGTTAETSAVPTTEPAPQPLPDPTPVPTAIVPAKKSRKGLVFALIGILLIALGLASGWYLFGRDDSAKNTASKTPATTQTTTKTTNPVKTEVLQPADIIAKVKTEAAKSGTLVDADTVTQLKSGQISYRMGTYSPAYKPAGYDFYISAGTGGSSVTLVSYYSSGMPLPTSTETSIRTAVMQLYKDLGLTKTDTYGDAESSSLTQVYTGKGVVCTIDDTTAQVSPTTVNCGLISAYADAAAKAKPVITALPSLTSTTFFGPVKIKDSQADGYQNAQVSVGDVKDMGGYAALFYKKDGGSWKYFKGTQEIIPCTEYNTTDIRNAFMGDACWDNTTNKESTVQ